ncbi:hypothetical protein HK102_002897 [Quaeritorhiza haematococci]|nr:hypothetical protein HK102_002897 [Quaeritorhiza haematococci]
MPADIASTTIVPATSEAASSGSICHVDHDRIYEDPKYRWQYVCRFVGFTEEDVRLIKESAPLVAPLVPTIVDAVYERLFSFDITKAVFLRKNEGFEGELGATTIDELDFKNQQIQFRKTHLAAYLKKLVTGQYDDAFFAYLDRVGRMHVDTPTKRSKINVEYIHSNALFGFVHALIAQALDSHPALQPHSQHEHQESAGAVAAVTSAISSLWYGSATKEQSSTPVMTVEEMKKLVDTRAKTLAAFSKLLWIQNDAFAKYYMPDPTKKDNGAH